MRVGITGHQKLADGTAWVWVRSIIDGIFSEMEHPVLGLTSLAIGADQVFAKAVLEHAGRLHVVVPFAGYELRFADGEDREEYLRLLADAHIVEVLPSAGSDEASYLKAGIRIADESDLLIAVWDGQPARGLGGTADIVAYALSRGLHIRHLDPVRRSVITRPSPG